MIDRGKRNVLGVLVSVVDYQGAVSRVIDAAKTKQAMAVSALAVHGVMTGVLDPLHKYRLNKFDLICPDGQPVRWAINLLYREKLKDRVYGPDLTLKICEQAAQEGLSIYFYGSRFEVIKELSKNLMKRYPKLKIAGSQESKFRQITPIEKQAVIDEIKKTEAQITFIGLGCPRQEVWAYEFNKELSMPVIAVGAAFDFHADLLPQAPAIMQKWGLEWLYRLYCEPIRLWKRYLYLNPYYLFLLALQLFRLRELDPDNSIRPEEEVLYG